MEFGREFVFPPCLVAYTIPVLTEHNLYRAIKSMLGELTDRSDIDSGFIRMIVNEPFSTNQSVAFSALTLAYRIGQIVGLPIGGFLAHPERHLPSVFNTPFWLYYPFLLPCLAGAAFAVIGVLLGLVCLTEVSCPSIALLHLFINISPDFST